MNFTKNILETAIKKLASKGTILCKEIIQRGAKKSIYRYCDKGWNRLYRN